MNKNEEKTTEKKLGISFGKNEGIRKYVFGDTIDELIDGLEILKDGEFINYFVWKFPNLSEEQLKRLDIIMAQTNDGKEILSYLCKRKKVNNVEKFEDILIKTKKLSLLVNFAEEVEGANIRRLENIILASKDAQSIYDFAREVEGANLLKLKNALLETKKAFYIALFFERFQKKERIINGEDIKKAEEIVVQSLNVFAIINFAKGVDGANIEKLEDAIIKTENGEKIIEFAEKVETADINKIWKAIKEMKNSWLKKEFKKRLKSKRKHIF